jgi:hypothetical protein
VAHLIERECGVAYHPGHVWRILRCGDSRWSLREERVCLLASASPQQPAVENEKFSFVHSDVDLYASTRSVLEFFYPRMLPGGVILTHDFATAHGSTQSLYGIH